MCLTPLPESSSGRGTPARRCKCTGGGCGGGGCVGGGGGGGGGVVQNIDI